jgi:hypothetical protein
MLGKISLSIATAGLSAGILACLTVRAAAEQALSCLGTKSELGIGGLYVDNFGGVQVVNKHNWISGIDDNAFLFHICDADSGQHYIIAQNDPENAYAPLQYSRFEWAIDKQHLYYCQQVWNASTPQEAADFSKTPRAGRKNMCTGNQKFYWTEMILVRK